MINISNILNGWSNFIKKSEVTELIAVERATHCIDCKETKHSKTIKALIKDDLKEVEGYICNICKCPLSAKLRSENEQCPLGKWD